MRAIRPESIGTLEAPLVCGGLVLDPATLEVRLDNRVISYRCASTGCCDS